MNKLDLIPLPARPDLDQYRKQAKELVRLLRADDEASRRRWEGYHPQPKKSGPILLADAQAIIAREHGIVSWPKFARFIEELNQKRSSISAFEAAADAIVSGDEGTLRRLLDEHLDLVRQRSEREHRCFLIHYIGANGFENYRQKTPANAPDILRILLDAGAEVDAVSLSYGRDTTLGLVATSIHPVNARVQFELMEMLIAAGAKVDGVNGCLRNGRGAAAKFLADRGAPLDLEGAAGVGDLAAVKDLLSGCTTRELALGFNWACEYGHQEVVSLLLDHGADPGDDAGTGLTGLHWAIVGGQVEMVQLLIGRGIDLEARNAYGGTALGAALWSASNGGKSEDYRPIIELLLAAGARKDAEEGMQGAIDRVLQPDGPPA